MNKLKERILISICIVSVAINFVFYVVEINPFVIRKLNRDDYIEKISVKDYKEKICNAALKMATSEETLMPFSRNHQIIFVEIAKAFNAKDRMLFLKYHYPKALLLNGLAEYGLSKEDTLLLGQIRNIYQNNYVKADGTLNIMIDKVDQALFGLSLINLDRFYKNNRYRNGILDILNFLKSNIETEKGLILYRKRSNVQFVDAMGMVCPFLIKYGVTYNDSLALRIAYDQLLFYIKYGLDEKSHFPFHAVNIHNELRLGPATWGRGIGWYALALAYTIYYTNSTNNPYYSIFCKEMCILYNNLMLLKVNNYWGQFISGDTTNGIDASTTTMLLYSFGLAGYEIPSQTALVDLFKVYTNTEGFLDFTSGDTEDINRYSDQKGKSELSQGLLLSLFSLDE